MVHGDPHTRLVHVLFWGPTAPDALASLAAAFHRAGLATAPRSHAQAATRFSLIPPRADSVGIDVAITIGERGRAPGPEIVRSLDGAVLFVDARRQALTAELESLAALNEVLVACPSAAHRTAVLGQRSGFSTLLAPLLNPHLDGFERFGVAGPAADSPLPALKAIVKKVVAAAGSAARAVVAPPEDLEKSGEDLVAILPAWTELTEGPPLRAALVAFISGSEALQCEAVRDLSEVLESIGVTSRSDVSRVFVYIGIVARFDAFRDDNSRAKVALLDLVISTTNRLGEANFLESLPHFLGTCRVLVKSRHDDVRVRAIELLAMSLNATATWQKKLEDEIARATNESARASAQSALADLRVLANR